MEPFAGYLLRSAVWLTGFSMIYFLFLRNERFFRIKRFYLVTGMVASFIFPLIAFHYKVEIPAPPAIIPDLVPQAIQATQAPPISPAFPARSSLDYRYVLLFLYITGIIFLAFRMIKHMKALSEIIRKSQISSRGKVRIVKSSGIPSSFSFFNYVFISPAVMESEAEQILNHEEVHVQQNHWFDLILAELIRMIQWANPFAWIYAGFIRQNHEYLADEAALERAKNPADYRATLMNQIFNAPVVCLSNSFSYSINKKRFDMMKKTVTSPYRKLKVLLVLPVLAIVFYAFATPKYSYIQPSDNKTAIIENTADIVKNVKGVVLKEDGTPLSGAAILVASTKIRATTDGSGNFNLTEVPEDAFIVISCRGYLTQFLKADFGSTMTVKLLKDTDYKEREIEIVSESQELPAISSEMDKTWNTLPEALIVIDGNESSREELKNMSPNNIQSLSILKNESATRVFGEKGKNGIIIVTTKNAGSSGQNAPPPPPPAPQTQTVQQTQQFQPPRPPMPEYLVVIDGVITDKNRRDVQKELGYDFGLAKVITGQEAIDKYGEKGAKGVYEIITRKKALEMGLKPPFPRLTKDDHPTFQGEGSSRFSNWIAGQLKYPAEAQARNIEGWVSVSYTVELDGTITNVKSAVPVIPVLSDAVVNVVKSSPKWDPPKNPAVDEPLNTGVMVRFKLPDQILTQAPFVVVEQMPMFPGGDAELLKFIGENTNYPDSAKAKGIQGRVIVRFIVNTEGKAEGATILKGVDTDLDAEALRVVNTLPVFNPGKQGGQPVNVWYMVPITFTLK